MQLFRRRKKSRAKTYPPGIPPFRRETTENSQHWWKTVRSLIDALPWFGQDVPPSAGSRRRKGDRLLSEQRDLLRLMLDAVYVDMDSKEVTGLQPKPSFLPLFGLDEPVEAADLVLSTNLTPGGLDSGRGRHQLNPYQDSLAETGSVAWLRKAA